MAKFAFASLFTVACAGIAMGGVILPRLETRYLLRDCPGGPVGNADKCTFEPTGEAQKVYKYTATDFSGSECGKSENDGEISLEVSYSGKTSFSIGGGGGVGASGGEKVPVGVSIEVEAEYTTKEAFGRTEKNTKVIKPGMQAVYVREQPYDRHLGRLRVNYGKRVDGHYIWYVNDFKNDVPRDDSEAETRMVDFPCGVVMSDEIAKYNANPTKKQFH